MFKRKPVVAQVDGRDVACVIRGAGEFIDRPREAQLDSGRVVRLCLGQPDGDRADMHKLRLRA